MRFFRKRVKKGKTAKFENILKKDTLKRATIARMKQLEYALETLG